MCGKNYSAHEAERGLNVDPTAGARIFIIHSWKLEVSTRGGFFLESRNNAARTPHRSPLPAGVHEARL